MKPLTIFTDGLIRNNPTFVIILGMCPTLGTTSSALTGLSMGIATLFVLICSNAAISALAPLIPDKVRIPAYIIIIASFVTALQMLMQAYTPALYAALGIFIPLIVVNCILLGRAEAFASRNTVAASVIDALGTGLGFTAALTLIGILRETLGAGTAFGLTLYPSAYAPLLFILAPGAFIVLGLLIAAFNRITRKA